MPKNNMSPSIVLCSLRAVKAKKLTVCPLSKHEKSKVHKKSVAIAAASPKIRDSRF